MPAVLRMNVFIIIVVLCVHIYIVVYWPAVLFNSFRLANWIPATRIQATSYIVYKYIVYIYICTVLHISKPWRINFSQVSRIRVLLSGSGSNFFPASRSGSAKNRPDPGFKVRIRIGEKARIRIRNTVFYLFTTEYVHTVLYFWTILYCTVYTKYDLEI